MYLLPVWHAFLYRYPYHRRVLWAYRDAIFPKHCSHPYAEHGMPMYFIAQYLELIHTDLSRIMELKAMY